MALLKNGTAQELPIPNHDIRAKIIYSANHLVDDSIKDAVGQAIYLVGKQLDIEDIEVSSLPRVNIIYSNSDEITFTIGEQEIGNHTSLIIYQTTKMLQYNHLQKLTIATEELCHHFWDIEDEVAVKHKVTDVLKIEYPNIKIDDLYNMDEI